MFVGTLLLNITTIKSLSSATSCDTTLVEVKVWAHKKMFLNYLQREGGCVTQKSFENPLTKLLLYFKQGTE